MGFTRDELEACRGRSLPDLLPDPLNLLFVGINPSLWTIAAGAHFSRPGNRFYPALHEAGITDTRIDAAAGFTDADLRQLTDRGIGITNLVPVATARADELDDADLIAGRARLDALVREHHPRVVAVLGVGAYRTAFHDRKAKVGRQESPWPGIELFVAPNPSGLNAHYRLADLAESYGEIARAAGI